MNTQLTIVIPVRNESASLPYVITELVDTLKNIEFQIIIIDDGDDNTPEVIQSMKLNQVACLRRRLVDRDGLAGAVIYGFKQARSQFVALMDGDGQHPPKIIYSMYQEAINGNFDMILASRYINGGSTNGLKGNIRKIYSNLLRILPIILFPKRLRNVTDPLTGCFLVETSSLRFQWVKPIGWKISLDILLFSSIKKYGEVAYIFKNRIDGESKANFKVGLNYFRQLFSLIVRFYFFFQIDKNKDVNHGYYDYKRGNSSP